MTKESNKKTATYKFNDPNPRGALEKALAPIVAKAVIREQKSREKENKNPLNERPLNEGH